MDLMNYLYHVAYNDFLHKEVQKEEILPVHMYQFLRVVVNVEDQNFVFTNQ